MTRNESKVSRTKEKKDAKSKTIIYTKDLGIPEVWAADRLGGSGPSRIAPIKLCRGTHTHTTNSLMQVRLGKGA